MNRRHIIQAGLVGLAVPTLASADVPVEPTLQLDSVIGTNHGHAFTMSPVEALQHLRASVQTGGADFDIRGASSHGHPLHITHAQFLELFVTGAVDLVATGSHSHSVRITLDVV